MALSNDLFLELRKEIMSLGRDEGLTLVKLEGTLLLSLMKPPQGWSVADASQAMHQLVVELASRIRPDSQRAAIRATMRLEGLTINGETATQRQVALADRRRVHHDTVRAWWTKAAEALARALPSKIEELNKTPSSWEVYLSARDSDLSVPEYSFERVDVAWRLRGKVGVEMLTYRWLVARADDFDRVRVKAWYFNDPNPDKCEIVPLLNCEALQVTHGGRGQLLVDLGLPEPLAHGGKAFIAYRVVFHSDRECEPVVLHEVRSAGDKVVNFRLQFDPEAMPVLVWHFSARDDAEPYILPEEGSTRYLRPTRLGYVEYVFRDCLHGVKHGIGWRWRDR